MAKMSVLKNHKNVQYHYTLCMYVYRKGLRIISLTFSLLGPCLFCGTHSKSMNESEKRKTQREPKRHKYLKWRWLPGHF